MASASALTGGTGDVNPQQLTFSITQTGNDTTTDLLVPVPIPRFSAKKNQSIVLELLRSEVLFDQYTPVAVQSSQSVLIGTSDIPANDDPTTFLVESSDFILSTAVGFQFYDRYCFATFRCKLMTGWRWFLLLPSLLLAPIPCF